MRKEIIALASSLSLCAVFLLATDSPVPMVPIPSLQLIDEGALVQTVGLVADLWSWDDGSENILLADPSSSCTIRVICSQGIRSQPGEYIHLGDEIMVEGEVFGSPSLRRLNVDSDHVSLLRQSRFVLTVEALSGCWQLFEGDHIEIRGILVRGDSEGELALRGMAAACQLTISQESDVDARLLGTEVVVAGTLAFDETSMALMIDAESMAPER